jgi:lipoprotein-anchoring transpeptidase ErfK/SrfK
MSLRRLTAFSFLLLALVVPAGAAAQEGEADTQRVIAAGTKAGGIDVGGQTIESAATNLELALSAQLGRTVVVKSAGRTFRLAPADAGFAFDALTTAKRAYYAGRDKGPGQDVPLALSVSLRKAREFADRVDRRVSRAPRNATLRIGLRRMHLTRSRKGRTINEVSLSRRISKTLVDPARSRTLRARVYPDRPAVTVETLRRRNGTVLTVDRANKKLRLFKRLKLRKTYGIAIGAAGFDTPRGLFRIQSKQVNPAWHVPNSDWAGGLRGQTIPGGAPNNPLKARWLGVNGSVGIHGTAEEWSIGSRASHGCIRMRVRDVKDLYPRVPMGAPVLIR